MLVDYKSVFIAFSAEDRVLVTGIRGDAFARGYLEDTEPYSDEELRYISLAELVVYIVKDL